MENFPSSCLRLCLTFQTFRAYGVSRRQSRAPCSPPPLSLSPAPRFWGTEARKVRKGAEFLGNGEFWKQQLWMKHQRVLLPGAFPSWEQGMGGMGMGKQLMGCLCSERCVEISSPLEHYTQSNYLTEKSLPSLSPLWFLSKAPISLHQASFCLLETICWLIVSVYTEKFQTNGSSETPSILARDSLKKKL